MGSLKRIVLAGAAALVMIPPALAADLMPPPPPPMLPRVVAPVEEFSGWYLRADVGVGRQEFDRFDHTATNQTFVWPASWRIDQRDIKDTAFVAFGAGYQWNSWFRTDVTGEYRISSKGKAIGSYTEFCPNGGRCFDVYDFDHQASVFLVNAYLDLGTWWCLTPFVGVGVGGARHEISAIHDVGFVADGTSGFGLPNLNKDKQVTWDVAWAVHAGLGYKVSNNLTLEFAYRYLNMGDPETAIVACNSAGCAGAGPHAFYTLKELTSHDFKLGMRWLFNEPVAPPPAYPIMRKG